MAIVRHDAVRARLAAGTLDLNEFGPAARANVIDLRARQKLEARGIDDPTEDDYVAAVAKAEDELKAAGL